MIDVDVCQSQELILIFSALEVLHDESDVGFGVSRILQERVSEGVNQNQGERLATLPAILQTFEQCIHALAEFTVAIREGVVLAKMAGNLLKQAFDGG